MWHERWTWADRGRCGHAASRFIQFNLANGVISIVGNLVLMRFLIATLHLHYMPANIIAISACSLFNFMVSDRVVF
jgi:putative flippase GtrA